MKKTKACWQRSALLVVAALVLGMTFTRARAGEFGLRLAAGVADHDVKKSDLAIVWDPGLKWGEIGNYHFTVVGEAHAAYWAIGEDGAVHAGIWEFGFTPVFRFIRDSGWLRPYVEGGVGIRLLSHVRETQDRTMSSSFQFADMVGVGAQFGDHQQYQAGFRFQHLSNAGIKRPNPGINFSEIYMQYNF
ncbi:TPA: acyloxyacyl hydrolase [Burkholderia cenocepacia]|uniref:acyloxyacyl hydrolase n=1 Tax=Burkholderia cenocepacia TaxID=95486 RepID=UPI0038BA488E